MNDADRFEGAVGKEVRSGKDGKTPAVLIVAAVDQQELGLVVAVEQFAAAHGDAVAVDRGGDQVAVPQVWLSMVKKLFNTSLSGRPLKCWMP